MVAVTLPWGIERDRYLGGSRAMQLEGQAGHAIHERAVLKKLKARTNGRDGRTLRQGQAGSSAKKERAGTGESPERIFRFHKGGFRKLLSKVEGDGSIFEVKDRSVTL